MRLQESEQVLYPNVQASLSEIGTTDIVIGIPCYNNHNSIHHVVQTVSQGLAHYYPYHRAVLLVVDGHSIDGTREQARIAPPAPQQTEIITCEQGIQGKGSALRSVFAVAVELDAQACLCVDADLRSIMPDWVYHMLDPLLEHSYDYVAPLYARYKYDGTITNNLVYCLTRALYGQRIRQPIGGDFAFAGWLARHYLEQPVWDTDVARFGIDIWMTLQAVVVGARLCQANLGVKLHDAKDPAAALGPMFQQVCGTLFSQIEQDFHFWSSVQGSDLISTFGMENMGKPVAMAIDHLQLVRKFQQGFWRSQTLYQHIFSKPVYQALHDAAQAQPDRLEISRPLWARLLYEMMATYHHLKDHRDALITSIIPLYLGQVASFVNQTQGLDFWEVEAVIESLVQDFEREKPHLLNLWLSSTIEYSRIDAIQHLLTAMMPPID